MSLRGIVSFALATSAALFAAAPAGAAQPECGDEIKKDVKLTANLDCTGSNSDGLEIAADGVTVDLNGHTIKGPVGSYYGIDNGSNYHEGLKVTNGTIKGFNYSINAYQGGGEKFTDLDLRLLGDNDGYGIYLQYTNRAVLKDIQVRNASYGLYLYEIADLTAKDIRVRENDSNSGYGLYGAYLTGKISKLEANDAYYGLYVYGYSDGLLIEDGEANGAGYSGFYLSNSTPLTQYRYVLRDNTANNADSYGFYAQYDVSGSGNRAKGAGTENCRNVPCR